MQMNKVLAGLLLAMGTVAAHADFNAYIIRNSNDASSTPVINDLGGGKTQIIVDKGGEKAALGSSDIDGTLLGNLTGLTLTRLDDITRFSSSASGQARAPYLNFWITDGIAGHFAVVANEPTNGEWNSFYASAGVNGFSLNLDFADLAGMSAKIYETSDTSWLPSSVGLKFSDLAGFTIMAPSAAYLTTPGNGVGTGAPRELGTNEAYGVNWIFGDTLSNYSAEDPGYVVRDAAVSTNAVPEPASIALVGVALAGLGLARRRKA